MQLIIEIEEIITAEEKSAIEQGICEVISNVLNRNTSVN
jgi:hypothetical protein